MRGKFKCAFRQKRETREIIETIILIWKEITEYCVVIFALFFETSMLKITYIQFT